MLSAAGSWSLLALCLTWNHCCVTLLCLFVFLSTSVCLSELEKHVPAPTPVVVHAFQLPTTTSTFLWKMLRRSSSRARRCCHGVVFVQQPLVHSRTRGRCRLRLCPPNTRHMPWRLRLLVKTLFLYLKTEGSLSSFAFNSMCKEMCYRIFVLPPSLKFQSSARSWQKSVYV